MRFPVWSALAGAICLLGSHALAQTTWTVSPTGPADFPSVTAAVDAVAEGDVLLIAPGDYGSVTVAKSLTLLGSQDALDRPRFDTLLIEGAAWVELYHLEARLLHVEDVTGPSRVEDVVATEGAQLLGPGDILLRGCTLTGADGFNDFGGDALYLGTGPIVIARVQIVDCTLRGGDASGVQFGGLGALPGAGIRINANADSRVTLIGCDIIGGSRGTELPAGLAGTALHGWLSEAVVEVRGSSFHGLRGGALGPGQPLGGGPAYGAPASVAPLILGNNLEVVGALTGPVDFVPARPYAHWTGTGGPGSARTFEVFGAAGDLAVAFFGFGATYDPSTIAGLGMPLTVDPSTVFMLLSGALVGQDSALGFGFTLPPTVALAGVALPAQAAVVHMNDLSVSLTNGDDLLISF